MRNISPKIANQDRTKVRPFFDFLLNFSIILLEFLSLASKLSCEAVFKISSKNVEKCRIEPKKGPIVVIYNY